MKKTLSAILLLFLLLLSACSGGKTTVSRPPSVEPTEGDESASSFSLDTSAPSAATPASPTENTPSATESASPEGPRITFTEEGDGGTVAVWWWNANDAFHLEKREALLDFLQKNAVNEIYFCYPNPQNDRLYAFVKEANARGMEVSLLSGDVSFIEPDSVGATAIIKEFLSYQNAHPDAPLRALHLDVEPHQHPDFSEKRDEILQKYADYLVKTCQTLHDAGEKAEFDVPFWFDEFTVRQNGETADLLTLLASHADGMAVMAYRDSAEEIYALSEKEVALCKQYGSRIILGVDCYSNEAPYVSFKEEGQRKMYAELKRVYRSLRKETRGKDYGIAIHYIDSWIRMEE